MGDLLGVIGVLVVAIIVCGRDVDQIPFRDADFDRRVHQVAWVDWNRPGIAALERPALVDIFGDPIVQRLEHRFVARCRCKCLLNSVEHWPAVETQVPRH